MKAYALIMAGGAGQRMAAEIPKQFLLLHGRPILMHTLSAFYQYSPTVKLVLVIPRQQQELWQKLCIQYSFDLPHLLAYGGKERFDSVRNGLQKIAGSEGFDADNSLIAVHDAVRPLVGVHLIETCYQTAERYGSAIPVTPLVDSLRRRDGEWSLTENRLDFCAVQTPQVFNAKALLEAYRQPYHPSFTDDASVMEAAGHRIRLVEGHRKNSKITVPEDLLLAEYWLKQLK
jgi:2-C-methyl-D-erythritol 4-phosphate cytidylyltransferase